MRKASDYLGKLMTTGENYRLTKRKCRLIEKWLIISISPKFKEFSCNQNSIKDPKQLILRLLNIESIPHYHYFDINFT